MEIKKVLANVSQDLTETEMSTARKNIGVTADLLHSTDASMTFTDTDNDKIGIALNGYDTVAGNGIVIDTDDLNHTFSIRTSETYDTVVNLDTTLTSGKYKLADNAGGTGPVGVDLKHGTLTVANSVSYTDTSHTGNQMVSDAYQMLITADGVPYYRTYNGQSREFTEWVDGFGPKGDNIYLDEDKTTVMYATSTSDQNPESIAETSWSPSIPSVDQGQYLWVRTILAFSDESTADPIYNVVYKAKDIGLDKTKTKVEYGKSSNGTDSTSVTSWSPSIPSVDQGQYLWVRTTLAFTDNSTADPIYNVVYQPKDIKLDSDNTKVEYGIAKTKYARPSSWSPNVPAIDQGDYLWVRTTMHFSDGSVAPEFCHVIYEPKDGSNGVSCTHFWNGTTLSITSASGTTSADLKGEKGDPGTWGGSVDTELSNTSTNPVQNKVVKSALDAKQSALPTTGTASSSYAINITGNAATASKVTINSGTGKLVTKDSAGNAYSSDMFSTFTDSDRNLLAVQAESTKQAGICLYSKNSVYSAIIHPADGFYTDNEFTLPAKSGTLALQDDIPDVDEFVKRVEENTFTEMNTFNKLISAKAGITCLDETTRVGALAIAPKGNNDGKGILSTYTRDGVVHELWVISIGAENSNPTFNGTATSASNCNYSGTNSINTFKVKNTSSGGAFVQYCPDHSETKYWRVGSSSGASQFVFNNGSNNVASISAESGVMSVYGLTAANPDGNANVIASGASGNIGLCSNSDGSKKGIYAYKFGNANAKWVVEVTAANDVAFHGLADSASAALLANNLNVANYENGVIQAAYNSTSKFTDLGTNAGTGVAVAFANDSTKWNGKKQYVGSTLGSDSDTIYFIR